MLADLARIKDMDHKEHMKFKVLKDLPVKIREKVLKDQDMTLDNMSVLVADVEAMDIVNNSLKSEQPKLAPGKGQKTKEDAMPALEVKPGKTLKSKKKTEERPRREDCGIENSAMLCNICGKENNHVTAVCLQQFASSTAAGLPGGTPAIPGLQSGMVAMEERRVKKRSYAQVVGGGDLGSAGSPPPSPSPTPPSLPASQLLAPGRGGGVSGDYRTLFRFELPACYH